MANPIRNAIKPITKRDLVSCKRCGCPDLAWIQYKGSGKWALVETATERPFWSGDSSRPEGLWAMKFKRHECATYLAEKSKAQETVARQEWCHPLADKPAEILQHAMHVIIMECVHDKYQQLQAGKGPLFDAMEIFGNALAAVGK